MDPSDSIAGTATPGEVTQGPAAYQVPVSVAGETTSSTAEPLKHEMGRPMVLGSLVVRACCRRSLQRQENSSSGVGNMDWNRNQVFFAGLLLVLIGFQFRMVESFVFTPEFTQWLARSTSQPLAVANATLETLAGAEAKVPAKVVNSPEWLGWCLMSIGSVLVLQSFAMKKPSS